MDKKIYPENFERFLKGYADEFKLSPSKKVWHGIYNDLHPGRRWPSIAISMLFIFTLVIVGHLNTNNGRTTGLNDLSTQALTETPDKKIAPTNEQNITTINAEEVTNYSIEEVALENSSENILTNNDQAVVGILTSTKIQTANTTTIPIADQRPEVSPELIENKPDNLTPNNIEEAVKENNELSNKSDEILTVSEEIENAITAEDPSNTTGAQTEALNLKKVKRKNNVSWSYYFTPSLGYRFFSDESMNTAVRHQSMFGHEAGTAMNIRLIKNLQLTSGLQLNYSGYSIKANNTHPVIASLQLNEPGGVYSVYSTMSNYGNSAANDYTKLKNYSFQASVPIGLQYMFAETENMKFGAAASFQPTFIIASDPYLLSTDKKNYLTNSDVVRNWNMNTSLNTFVSFSHNSLNWQIGPQVRYQLLSTYSKRYPLTENLVNYGIRVGISKSR